MTDLRESDLAGRLDEMWGSVSVVDETGSTNDDLMALAVTGAVGGQVIVAEVQTAGRGRLDRRWSAPAGAALTFSVLIRPAAEPRIWGWLPVLAGLAIHDALSAAGADVALKWPNDVQLGTERAKVAGILTQIPPGAPSAVVIGIGINVVTHDGLPEGATAVDSQWDADRASVLVAVLNALAARVRQFESTTGDAERSGIAADYREACGTLGQQVRVFLPGRDEPVTGRARDVDDEGRLIVDTDEGELVVGAGDVVHVRPAT